MSTIVTSGGLGNQFFQSLALSILVEKNNLKVTYNTMNKFRFFDILYEGTLSYDRTTILNESTFFELLESYPIQNNILVQRETFFQNKEISNYYYQYLRKEEIQQRVMKANPYKTRYGCGIRSKAEDNHAYSEGLRRSPEEYDNNTDIFIHIRLKDTEPWNPGIQYYLRAIQQINPDNNKQIYIASDDITHNIIQEIIKKYSNTVVLDPYKISIWEKLCNNELYIEKCQQKKTPIFTDDFSEYDTIQFGCTCKYIILSHGTFSAMIGLLAYHSDVYYPDYNYSIRWHGDIFSIPSWKKIDKN